MVIDLKIFIDFSKAQKQTFYGPISSAVVLWIVVDMVQFEVHNREDNSL